MQPGGDGKAGLMETNWWFVVYAPGDASDGPQWERDPTLIGPFDSMALALKAMYDLQGFLKLLEAMGGRHMTLRGPYEYRKRHKTDGSVDYIHTVWGVV